MFLVSECRLRAHGNKIHVVCRVSLQDQFRILSLAMALQYKGDVLQPCNYQIEGPAFHSQLGDNPVPGAPKIHPAFLATVASDSCMQMHYQWICLSCSGSTSALCSDLIYRRTVCEDPAWIQHAGSRIKDPGPKLHGPASSTDTGSSSMNLYP